MNVTPKMLTLLKASPNMTMGEPYRKGAANTSKACARWGLLHRFVGQLSLSKFGETYLTQRGE